MRARWVGVLLAILGMLVSGLSPAVAGARPDPQPNVVGGSDTGIENVPWQVALIDPDSDSDYKGQFCGGSILAPRWVVTAAHCIEPGAPYANRTPANLVVLAGKAVLSDTTASSGPYVRVAEIHVHDSWVPTDNLYDIALLHLATPLSFNSQVAPIPLPTSQDPTQWPAGNTEAVISGWGYTKDGDQNSAPRALQSAQVNVLASPDVAECIKGKVIDPSQLCAGFVLGGVDTCQGDSGGPLTVMAGVRVLAGITSVGAGCGKPLSPGVYTRVTSYLGWINDHVALDNNAGLWVSGSGLNFASQPLGSVWPAQAVTVTNQGNAGVDGVGVSLEGAHVGNFPLSSNCPSTLGSGGSCTVTVGYTPAVAGDSQALVRIQPGGLTVSLSGNATTPVIPPPPVPAKPTGVTAKAKKKSVRARWNAVPGATQYKVRLKGNDAKRPKKKVKVTVRTASTSTVIRKALLKGATFRVCVSASNSSGSSASTCFQGMRTR